MKEARGQNKLSQNASLLVCYCSFEFGHFSPQKNQSERQAIELLLKVQISLNHHFTNTYMYKSGVFTSIPLFANFTLLSMEFPITNRLPISYKSMGIFN